jgi:hypothetical protein
MMDDQLVEIDARKFLVSRRFSLAKGKEGPLPADGGEMLSMWIEGARQVSGGKTSDPAEVGYAAMGEMKHAMTPNSCSTTWAQPSADGKQCSSPATRLTRLLKSIARRGAYRDASRPGAGRTISPSRLTVRCCSRHSSPAACWKSST